jgi:hypothetical protein
MSNIEIYYANDNRVILKYICSENKVTLIDIINSEKPNKKPDIGIMELNKIYIKSFLPDTQLKIICNAITERICENTEWTFFGRIGVDIDYESRDEYQENHLFVLHNGLNQDENEFIVSILDEFNAESFHSIGSFIYETEFQKIFYMEE